MAAIAGTSLVAAESILALTPVAIKKTPLDPISAIWSRTLSSAALGYLLAGDRSLISAKEWTAGVALGHANLLHIASSYESFRNLPAGQAMSLLYTYPLWNLVLNATLGDESFTVREYGLMALAAVGSVLLNQDPGHAVAPVSGGKPRYWWGVSMGLVMALTESAMHFILRQLGWRDAAKSVWVVNGSASVWLGAAQLFQELLFDGKGGPHIKGSLWDATLLTAFHSVTMFSGYWLRFFAVPRLSVVTYSILSYAGLLAAYIYGLFILGERPGWMSIVGALLILASGIFIELGPGSGSSSDSGPVA
jgi:drug/metabolite transporter (DMT)-like permease